MYHKRITFDPAAKAEHDRNQVQIARDRLAKVSAKKHKIRKENSNAR